MGREERDLQNKMRKEREKVIEMREVLPTVPRIVLLYNTHFAVCALVETHQNYAN